MHVPTNQALDLPHAGIRIPWSFRLLHGLSLHIVVVPHLLHLFLDPPSHTHTHTPLPKESAEIHTRGEDDVLSHSNCEVASLDAPVFEPGMIHHWDRPGEGFGCLCSRPAEEWNGLVIGNREERRERREDVKRKNGRKKRRGKGTHKAVMRTVFSPSYLG